MRLVVVSLSGGLKEIFLKLIKSSFTFNIQAVVNKLVIDSLVGYNNFAIRAGLSHLEKGS